MIGEARVLVVADGAGLAARELAEAARARVIGPVASADGAAALAGGGYDVAVADLRRGPVPDALIEALARARAIVLLDRAQLDGPAGALALAPGVALLCEADAFDQAATLANALARAGGSETREESEEARAARLRRISDEMERLARSLADIARAGPPARSAYVAAPASGFRGAPPAEPDAAAIRGLIRARRLRDQFFDATLFADPAWDMLLDLAAARLEGAQVSVSSLCIAAAVPPTTALRWIGVLADAGLIERLADAQDRRRIFIALSEGGATAMAGYLGAAARGGTLPL